MSKVGLFLTTNHVSKDGKTRFKTAFIGVWREINDNWSVMVQYFWFEFTHIATILI